MFEFWHQNQRLATLEFGKKILKKIKHMYIAQKQYVTINKKKLLNKVEKI